MFMLRGRGYGGSVSFFSLGHRKTMGSVVDDLLAALAAVDDSRIGDLPAMFRKLRGVSSLAAPDDGALVATLQAGMGTNVLRAMCRALSVGVRACRK